jgi:hypothetical protein
MKNGCDRFVYDMNRREFLKTSFMGLGALALSPLNFNNLLPGMNRLGRIATVSVSIYKEPWDKSVIVSTRYRDELLNLYFEVVSDKGPTWNPIWYRVWGGYIHSKLIQIVEDKENDVNSTISQGGQLAEITVPFVQSMRFKEKNSWDPLYRLYYGSMHWIVDVIEGPDHEPWYRIKEPWSQLTYDVPGKTMRLIPDGELLPISPDVPAEDKRIEVSISQQELVAYEKDIAVYRTKVSTGLNRTVPPGSIPWETPYGQWNIESKMPTQHMGNGAITSDVQAYELAGIPWVCYFHVNGNATHGTYWHNNFGNPMSHGCINMRMEDARWVFLWSTPIWSPGEREKRGRGTPLIVSA